LSDFEVTDGDEENIYIGKCEKALLAARQATTNWFQPWDEASSSSKGKGEDILLRLHQNSQMKSVLIVIT
jgi:hypothetical protein